MSMYEFSSRITAVAVLFALGIGTATASAFNASLVAIGPAGIGAVLVAPQTPGGDAELLLAEDENGTFGFKIRYDGGDNELELFGRVSGIDVGPWLTIDRGSGAVEFLGPVSGATPDPPCFSDTLRFVDCGNGTVTDTVTSLIWLANAGCLADQSYSAANSVAHGLAAGVCGLDDGSQPGDWRLPTKSEWEAVVNPSCATEPLLVGNGTTSADSCHAAQPWATNVQFAYWSSTTSDGMSDRGWVASLFAGTGMLSTTSKTLTLPVWPVRAGR